jgi:starch phosphorylase
MKFMMNGAVTIGTLDGANVEIREAVGEENFFLFGLTVEEIAQQRQAYDPSSIIDNDEDFSRVVSLLADGSLSGDESAARDAVLHSIQNPHDPWMTAADFRSFVDAQQRAEAVYRNPALWTKMSILNTASSGQFSTDRTIRDYNRDIWRLQPVVTES